MNGKVIVYPDGNWWIAEDDDEILAKERTYDLAKQAGKARQKALKALAQEAKK